MDSNIRRYIRAEYGKTPPQLRLLEKYSPELVKGYIEMRTVTLPPKGRSEGHLSKKFKELVITGIEVALGRGQRGITHARKAVRIGATSREVFEVLAICIWLCGMSTFVDSGWKALRAAEDEESRLKKQHNRF